MDNDRFDRLTKGFARGGSRRRVVGGLLGLALGAVARQPIAEARAQTLIGGGGRTPPTGIFCGGIAAFPCPPGYECVDNPSDACDPNAGGADCGGVCRRIGGGGIPGPVPGPGPGPIPGPEPNPCAAILCIEGSTCCPNCGGICVPADVPCSEDLCLGEPCGPNRCAVGEVCCNESCGICTPPDGACIALYCVD